MINSLTVTNDLGESVTMGIGVRDTSELLISNIDGIDPAKANINVTDMATIDGSIYNSAIFPDRNIVISMYYNPDYKSYSSIEDLRHKSYQYFPIKKKVTLLFNTDNRQLTIDGYVESNEVNIFSELEQVQISIICPFPYFKLLGDSEHFDLGQIESLFEFPFENDSLTEPLLEFGEIATSEQAEFYYRGEVDTGCVIHFHAKGSISDIVLTNVKSEQTMVISSTLIALITNLGYDQSREILMPIDSDDGSGIYGVNSSTSKQEVIIEGAGVAGIINGDDIYISTISGQKTAILVRGNQTYNILGAIQTQGGWIQVIRGYNQFKFQAYYGQENIELDVTYDVLYAGV